MMNPVLTAMLRRRVLLIMTAVAFILFTLVHQLWFRSTAQRYTRALKQASDLGMSLDPDKSPQLMPPRLFALISQNTRTTKDAQEAANSGTLTAEFLGDLTQLMGRRGMQVVSTEPAPVTQDTRSMQIRAHIRVLCRYPQFVSLLDDVAYDQRLVSIDRFSITPDNAGMLSIDLWASRLVLKSGRP